MYYCISLYDLSVVEIREIVMQRKSSGLTAYFYHPRVPGKPAFSVRIDFQMRDENRWYTSLKIDSESNINVNQAVKDRVRELLTDMFVPYFDRLLEEGRLW